MYIIRQSFNFPNTIQLGDINNWQSWAIDWSSIDLILAGSPCQGFSFAGKQLAFDDPRSKLFFVFYDIFKHVQNLNPSVLFLLENVNMAYEHELVISKCLNIAPIEIDSSLVSAQSRKRLYWTNIAAKPFGLFGDLQCSIPQPKDKGILLRDILQNDVPKKYYLSDKMIESISKWASTDNPLKRILTGLDKTRAATARGMGEFHSDMTLLMVNKSINNECRQVVQVNPSTESNGIQPYQQNRVYDTDGIAPALLADMSSGTHAILDKSPCLHGFEHGTNGQFNKQLGLGGMIRRLTPVECERLQTVPDNYTACVSDTQRYKMLGNGWNIDTIVHILSYMI